MALSLFKKETKSKPARLSRIQKLSTSELTAWADTSILQLGMAFDQWRYKDQPFDECLLVLSGLTEILEELHSRVDV